MEKFTVSRDDGIYEAFPDVALTAAGRLVCVFAECTHHGDRGYTCVMVTTSNDRGRTWSPKRRLSEALRGDPKVDPWWNCPRASALSDGRLVAVCDLGASGSAPGDHEGTRRRQNVVWFSEDAGENWSGPHETPVVGIVPDQLVELRRGPHAGRWVLSAHTILVVDDEQVWHERCWLSDDEGANWSGPHIIAAEPGLLLCEGSVCELPGGELVCFMRENSRQGLDAFKCVSRDGGQSWEGPVKFPLPACHRPVAGVLADERVMITHRYMQGGLGWTGWWTQNTFAGLTDVESCLAPGRDEAHTRILPIDFDRSDESDTGYTGWVQFADGEIYIVNYIMDDAPKAQIRGYSVRPEDFLIEPDRP